MNKVHFSRVIDAAPGACLMLAIDAPRFTVLAVSAGYLSLTETRREDLVGRDLFEVARDNFPDSRVAADLRVSLERVIERHASDAMPVEKYDIRRSSGRSEERFLRLINAPVFDEVQTLAGITFWIEDVTEARRFEARLRMLEAEHSQPKNQQVTSEALRQGADAAAPMLAQEESLRAAAENTRRQVVAVLENITDAFFAVDADWRFTYVNGRAEEALGRRRDELLGKVLWHLFPDAWDSHFGREYRAAMDEKNKRVVEAYSSILDRWIEAHVHPSAEGLSVYFHDVTQRKQAEAALLEGERRRRSILENSMDAVLLTTPDGRIVQANSASTKLFGYSEDELRELGRHALVDVTDPQLAQVIEERKRMARFRGEVTMKRKDGARFSAELSSSTFRDENGVAWTSMFIRDISERKTREAERERLLSELDAKQRRLETVIENVPLGIIVYEPGGRLYVNRWTERLFGLKVSPSGGSAQYANRILYPDGTPVPSDELVSARVLRTGETILGAEFLVELPDGTRFPILGSAVPMRGSDGKVIGGLGVFQDVSERIKAEAAIRANERLLNGLFELLPVGLFITDCTGRIIRCNPAAKRIWGDIRYVGISELGVYKGFWEDGQPIAAEKWALARAVINGETSIGEVVRIQCFDGTEKTIINSALPIHDESGTFAGAVVVHEDITKLKEIEDQQRRAIKLRDGVVSIVAHDLRNPLNAILLMTRLLLRRVVEDRQREPVQAIINSAHQMNGLIRDLLDVTRLEGGSLVLARSAVLVKPIIEQVVGSHRHLIEEAKLNISVQTPESEPRIDADADRLMQVLSNLIGNAMKFTPPGGSITVAVEQQGAAALFSVEDTGQGIPEEQRAHIFDRFWQANRSDNRGAGLGLAICKGIVEAHNGHIWVESEFGHGSAFRFTIPIVPA